MNHLAPVCRDMRETVDFYHGLLGMPVTMTTQFGPEGHEQQIFFFDIGGGCHLAFMWAADSGSCCAGCRVAGGLPRGHDGS